MCLTACCKGQRHPFVNPIKYLKGFCPPGFIPLTVIPYSYSMWAEKILTKKKWTISKDTIRALGLVVKGLKAQVAFSSILTATIKGARRALIRQVCPWTFGFYHHQGFKLRMMENGQSNQQSCEGVTDRVPEKKSLVMWQKGITKSTKWVVICGTEPSWKLVVVYPGANSGWNPV